MLCGRPACLEALHPESVALFCDPNRVLHTLCPLEADALWAGETALRAGCVKTVIIALQNGKTLTVDRSGAAGRRADALKGTPTKLGLDRDEAPPRSLRKVVRVLQFAISMLLTIEVQAHKWEISLEMSRTADVLESNVNRKTVLNEGLKKLIEIASEALAPMPRAAEVGPLMTKLAEEIWSKKNGFYAFESALLVRPFSTHNAPLGVAEWNGPSGWKRKFDADLSAEIFFAEDVFGEQFSLRQNGVFKFNPETGEIELFAESLNGWAEKILENYALHTGQPLAHEWQKKHGALSKGCRLAPKLPFIAGGEYAVSNLSSMGDIELIEFRAQIANQIANLPDGAQIQIEVSD